MSVQQKKVSFFLYILIVLVVGSAQAGDTLTGKVVETMNSGGYSYALIEQDGKKTWVAIPQTVLGVGDLVEFSAGMNMGQYTSKTLGRTFDDIVFSGGVVAIKRHEDGAKKMDSPEEKLTLPKAPGSNGYRIAELYDQKKELKGKEVVVTGKVYKVSQFMGATWIRIKDGSGSRKKGNHKLIATSKETAVKGDVVALSGILVADKNVGGLSYEVVLEQAKVEELSLADKK